MIEGIDYALLCRRNLQVISFLSLSYDGDPPVAFRVDSSRQDLGERLAKRIDIVL